MAQNLRDCNNQELKVGAKLLIPATLTGIHDDGRLIVETDKPGLGGASELLLSASQVAQGELPTAA